MKLLGILNELHNFRYALWILTILFTFLVAFGPSDGSLGLTGKILLCLFASLLGLYLLLKYNYKRVKRKEANKSDSK
ncbi:hypothetical protein BST92_13355 [Nonlabens arenilitoris]|uniref:Uncharacterized protein n=1 Tax=Nonlabens arenilitoris TaxID=1217969 RepID=A0A2S7UEJ3_9FLAO|nr:hypothetical protein [Nonlabens arenilitoris]PQJ32844.1 hypothetical protein BST92_13355 [Nonlabens arenilitoris]